MHSPYAFSFRDLLDTWDANLPALIAEDEKESKKARINLLIHGQNFLFFFKFNNKLFGATDESRITFSIMKNKSEDGYKEMSFSATNLTDTMSGETSEQVFRYNNIKDIKIVTPEKAEKILMKSCIGKRNPSTDLAIISHKDDSKKHGLQQINTGDE